MRSVAVILALSSLAVAQTTVLDLPFFGFDQQPALNGTVLGVTNHVTTISIACTNQTSGECGLAPLQTLTIGTSTYDMNLADTGFTFTQNCHYSPSATAVAIGVNITATCSESASGSSANFPGSSTTMYSDGALFPVTVSGAAIASTSTPVSTTSTAATIASGNNQVTFTSSGPTSTHTGAGARQTMALEVLVPLLGAAALALH